MQILIPSFLFGTETCTWSDFMVAELIRSFVILTTFARHLSTEMYSNEVSHHDVEKNTTEKLTPCQNNASLKWESSSLKRALKERNMAEYR